MNLMRDAGRKKKQTCPSLSAIHSPAHANVPLWLTCGPLVNLLFVFSSCQQARGTSLVSVSVQLDVCCVEHVVRVGSLVPQNSNCALLLC